MVEEAMMKVEKKVDFEKCMVCGCDLPKQEEARKVLEPCYDCIWKNAGITKVSDLEDVGIDILKKLADLEFRVAAIEKELR